MGFSVWSQDYVRARAARGCWCEEAFELRVSVWDSAFRVQHVVFRLLVWGLQLQDLGFRQHQALTWTLEALHVSGLLLMITLTKKRPVRGAEKVRAPMCRFSSVACCSLPCLPCGACDIVTPFRFYFCRTTIKTSLCQ